MIFLGIPEHIVCTAAAIASRTGASLHSIIEEAFNYGARSLYPEDVPSRKREPIPWDPPEDPSRLGQVLESISEEADSLAEDACVYGVDECPDTLGEPVIGADGSIEF